MKKRGIRAERRARELLKKAGYSVIRSSASLGAFDLVAWNSSSVRFIQVKYTKGSARKALKDALNKLSKELIPQIHGVSVEVWVFAPGGWLHIEVVEDGKD